MAPVGAIVAEVHFASSDMPQGRTITMSGSLPEGLTVESLIPPFLFPDMAELLSEVAGAQIMLEDGVRVSEEEGDEEEDAPQGGHPCGPYITACIDETRSDRRDMIEVSTAPLFLMT